MEYVWGVLLIIVFALLNRVRGDDRWMRKVRSHPQQELGPKWLPGRPLYYVAPVIGALSYFVFGSVLAAAAFGTAYLIWGMIAWGRWFDLGRLPKDFAREGVKPDPFESFIDMISFGSDHVALFFRHYLMILPGLLILAYPLSQINLLYLAFPFAVLVVSAYELAWRIWPQAPIIRAELMTGVIWAGLLLVIS